MDSARRRLLPTRRLAPPESALPLPFDNHADIDSLPGSNLTLTFIRILLLACNMGLSDAPTATTSSPAEAQEQETSGGTETETDDAVESASDPSPTT